MNTRHTTIVLALMLIAGAPGALAQVAPYRGFTMRTLIKVGNVPVHAMPMDFNADGRMDILVANMGDEDDPGTKPPSIWTLTANINGGFDALQLFMDPDVLQPHQIALDDLDNDGFVDAVIADGVGHRLVSLMRQADGQGFLPNPFFSNFVTMDPNPQPRIVSVGLAQLNPGMGQGTDTFPDAVTVQHGQAIFRALGDGAGNFVFIFGDMNDHIDISSALLAGMETFAVAVGDVNGDGVPDAVTGNVFTGDQHGGSITVVPGSGATGGSFDPNIAFTFTNPHHNAISEPETVRLADVDNSGTLDILAVANRAPFRHAGSNADPNNGWSVFIALDGLGPQGFARSMFVPTTGTGTGFDAPWPYAVAVGDVNGDNLPDLVISHGGPNTRNIINGIDLSVMLNNGADPPTFTHAGVIGQGSAAALPFRFTRLAGEYDPNNPNQTMDNPDVYPHFVELADMDGDGDLDIVTTRTVKGFQGVFPLVTIGHVVIFTNLTICGREDLTADGVVDGADLSMLFNVFGPCPGCPEDLSGDGVVDGADLAIVLNAFGACSQAPAAATSGSAALTTSTTDTQTVIAQASSAYGFSSVDAYIAWLESLTPDQLNAHIKDLIDRLTK